MRINSIGLWTTLTTLVSRRAIVSISVWKGAKNCQNYLRMIRQVALAGAMTTTGTSTVAPITAEVAIKVTEVATVEAMEAVASIIIAEVEECAAAAIEEAVATGIMTTSPT